MAILYGEITSDRRDIVLMGVNGADWEYQEITANLQLITPLLRKSDPPGAILVPATWATVTQVAKTFELTPHIQWTPGPGLQQWIMAEILRRGATVTPLAHPETSREPMPHQLAGAFAIGTNHRFYLADDMGPQPVTTPVLTPSGWTGLGLLKPGDRVLDRYGNPARVEGIKFFGQQPVFRVTLSDRTSTLAAAAHPWRLWTPNDLRRKNRPDGRVLTTAQLMTAGLHQAGTGNAKWYLPPQPVIECGAAPGALPLAPYSYGALLGDGHLSATDASLTCPDPDIRDRVQEDALALGTTSHAGTRDARCPQVSFHRNGGLRDVLASLGALVNAPGKHVHESYLRGNAHVRREVLRGLLDTDGTVGASAVAEFSSASAALARDVAFLGRSLGAVVTESEPQPAWYTRDGQRVKCLDRHRVHLRFPADGLSPFWCERKAGAWASRAASVQRRSPPRTLQAIEPEGEAGTCCITLATGPGNQVYLTDTALIPTHNCGKSGSALLGLAELKARGKDPFPALIVSPASVVDSWLEEIEAWFPSWASTDYRGPKRTRLSARYQVYVMSYQVFRNDMKRESQGALPPLIRRLHPRSLIVDEAHAITDRNAQQSKAVRAAAPMMAYFVAMSGTPIKKDIKGFWPALYCIDPAAFPSDERYVNRYALRGASDYGPASEVNGLSPLRAQEFHTVMLGTMRHLDKADVLADLPAKSHSVRVVDIPPKWRAAYDEMEEDMIAHLPDSDDAVLPVMSTLTQLMRLQQLASSACDVTITTEWDEEKGEEKEVVNVFMKEPSWKVDELMAVLADHDGSPVITCAPHRQLMELAGARAAAAGYRTGYIIGGQAPAARRDVRHAFQRGEIDVLCVTTDAGGVGLTLTAAYTMVFLERPWAYWQAIQMESRSHRKGQQMPVHIIDIVTRNTVEARVRRAIQDKARSLSELVRNPRIVREVLGGLPADPKASRAA